jgi:hypothetical protein
LVFWYSWIVDDAYVYFRYVDNWVIHGLGLVWNPGEYVEGFSSPLWALLLGATRSLHLDYWVIIRVVAILSFVIFWYLACVVNRGLLSAPQHSPRRSYNVPLIYLSFTYAVACYFSSGLESPLVNVSAVIYAAGVLWPQSWLLQGLIGLTPLVRHELVLPFVLFLFWSLLIKKTRPITALTVFAISVGSYMLFRVYYYADLLPNTFYLKDDTWIVQGIAYVYDTILPYFTLPYVVVMGLIYWILSRHSGAFLQRNIRLAMIALGIPVAEFVVMIGGDPRHFRYLAFSYILFVLASGGLVERLTEGLPQTKERYLTMFLVLFGLSTALCYPRQLQQHPFFRSYLDYSHATFLRINDAAVHRQNPRGITPSWYSVSSYLAYDRAKSRFELGTLHEEAVGSGPRGRPVWSTATSELFAVPLIADSWCQTAYLHPASPVIHSLGLTEPFLARTRMSSDRPAHKLGLRPLAEDLLRIRSEYGFVRGAFDKAISVGKVPEWIRDNIDILRQIEEKAYNDHNLFVNIASAVAVSARIDPETTQNKLIEGDKGQPRILDEDDPGTATVDMGGGGR